MTDIELGPEGALRDGCTRLRKMLKSNVESEVDSMVKKLSALESGTKEGTGGIVSTFPPLSFLPFLRFEFLMDTLSVIALCFSGVEGIAGFETWASSEARGIKHWDSEGIARETVLVDWKYWEGTFSRLF